MRQVPDAPTGTMDLLFTHVIESAQTAGYTWFNLGMAPLSGVGKSRYARRDERLAGLAYDSGSRLYNYKGVRSFKEKFHPVWQSRYIAYPLYRPLPTLLVDIAHFDGDYPGVADLVLEAAAGPRPAAGGPAAGRP